MDLTLFIGVGAIAGTVREMGLFACHLETFDGHVRVRAQFGNLEHLLKNHASNASRLIAGQRRG